MSTLIDVMKSIRPLQLLLFLVVWSHGAIAASQGSEALKPLTVLEAINEALAKNPEIAVLRERLQSMRARAKQAPYLEDPEISIQFGGVPLANPTNLSRADSNMFGIRQKFPFFGKLGLKEKIALQEAKIMEEELRAKEREIISRVKMVYAELFMVQKEIEILREQLEIMRGIIRATEARYQVGKVTQQDVFKALLEQSQIMNQHILAEEERKTSEVRLNALLNRPPQTPMEIPSDLAVPRLSLTRAGLEEMALANRPELRGAERGIERAERMYELADRNRKFPDFMLGWDYWWMPTDEMTKNRYGAMVNITIPFSPWTLGKRNYEVEETLAESRVAKAEWDAVRNMTLREIGESWAKVQAGQRSEELYREGILSQADLSFRAAMTAYQTGRAEFVNLLEAQRALREARMGYYRAMVGLVQSMADLERAVGKDLP
ncbi:MAG: TolC family protein [Deltaproteobacteria bacterium]|nr:TolC family protein [Deltaproteobacteria bacterium]